MKPDRDMGPGHAIHLDATGEVFACREDQPVLLAMEAFGRRGIPVGCRSGGCGVCKLRVTAGSYRLGRMSRACVSATEEADGVVLACRLFPRSDLSLSALGGMAERCPPCSDG